MPYRRSGSRLGFQHRGKLFDHARHDRALPGCKGDKGNALKDRLAEERQRHCPLLVHSVPFKCVLKQRGPFVQGIDRQRGQLSSRASLSKISGEMGHDR